jgi:hypothetical protein
MSFAPHPIEPEPEPTVAIALAQMRLTSAGLRGAVLAGHQEAASITANDVRTRNGYVRWATPLRVLGDTFAPDGFERVRPGGFEVLRSSDGAFDITVAAGTSATGIRNRMPQTRIPRGPLTRQAVDFNRGQLRLDADVVPFGPNEIRSDVPLDRLTWLLLHFHEEAASEVRLELSVPVEFVRVRDSDRGIVTAFEPRLILPAIALGRIDDDDDEGDDEIDIPVDRR